VRHRVRILPPGVVPAARGVAVVRGMDEVYRAVRVVVPEDQVGLERESVAGVREVPPFDYVIVLRAHHDGWPGDRPVAFEGNVGDLTVQAAHRDLVPGQREGPVSSCADVE